MRRRLIAILAADVVGYSRLMADDEAGTLAALRAVRRDVFDPEIADRGGRVVKLMGDGLLVEFSAAGDAVDCALAIQRRLAEEGRPLSFRVGVNIGDVVDDGDDIYGDGVNVAARLEALAATGGICLSGAVRDSIPTRVAAGLEDAGLRELKNIDRPVRVWRWPATGEAPEDAARRAREKPGVAVLPFEALTADPEHRFTARGLTDDLATAIGKIDSLRTVAPESAARLTGRDLSPGEIGAELGVGFIVEGGVRASGGRLRINVRVMDCGADEPIWSNRFDGDGADVFALLDRITEAVSAALEVRLADGAQVLLWRREAGDPEAYERFLAGRAAYKEYSRRQNLKAREDYEAALERSPRFISAMVGLARTHIEDAAFGWSVDKGESLSAARELLDAATALSPDHALIQAERAHACMIAGEFPQGIAFAERAVAADPNLADALHVYATLLNCVGRHEDALRQVRGCLQLNPASPEFYEICLGETLIALGRVEQAVGVLQRVTTRKPNWLTARALLVAALSMAGRDEQASAAADTLISRSPGFGVGRWRALLHNPAREDVAAMAAALAKAGVPR